jgi:NADH dehydrogenase FAD-containing subunit
MASPAGRWLGGEIDRAGRVKVRADLSVPGHPDVFVIGDTAAVTAADGTPLPGVAPVAKQQGQYVARALVAPGKAAPSRRAISIGRVFRFSSAGQPPAMLAEEVVQAGRVRL